jgi:hypothetical protein
MPKTDSPPIQVANFEAGFGPTSSPGERRVGIRPTNRRLDALSVARPVTPSVTPEFRTRPFAGECEDQIYTSRDQIYTSRDAQEWAAHCLHRPEHQFAVSRAGYSLAGTRNIVLRQRT